LPASNASSSLSRWAGATVLVVLAVHCGGSPFYEDDGGGSIDGSDDSVAPDGVGEDVSTPAPDATDGRPSLDARPDLTHPPDASADAVADATEDRKATPDASGISDVVHDLKACQAVCAGCCDVNGICQAGNTAAACGTMGSSCQDCSTKNCGLPSDFGCCTTSFTCGCAVGGIVGCS
jgi:hypothetical protein